MCRRAEWSSQTLPGRSRLHWGFNGEKLLGVMPQTPGTGGIELGIPRTDCVRAHCTPGQWLSGLDKRLNVLQNLWTERELSLPLEMLVQKQGRRGRTCVCWAVDSTAQVSLARARSSTEHITCLAAFVCAFAPVSSFPWNVYPCPFTHVPLRCHRALHIKYSCQQKLNPNLIKPINKYVWQWCKWHQKNVDGRSGLRDVLLNSWLYFYGKSVALKKARGSALDGKLPKRYNNQM